MNAPLLRFSAFGSTQLWCCGPNPGGNDANLGRTFSFPLAAHFAGPRPPIAFQMAEAWSGKCSDVTALGWLDHDVTGSKVHSTKRTCTRNCSAQLRRDCWASASRSWPDHSVFSPSSSSSSSSSSPGLPSHGSFEGTTSHPTQEDGNLATVNGNDDGILTPPHPHQHYLCTQGGEKRGENMPQLKKDASNGNNGTRQKRQERGLGGSQRCQEGRAGS